MVQKHLIEQVELLLEHLQQGSPDPEFLESHAMAIVALAQDINLYSESGFGRRQPALWLKAS